MTLRVVASALLVCAASAQDWPQWRGPRRDGTTSAAMPAEWPERLRQVWKASVGEGHSSPVVSGERVFQFARQGDNEAVLAFDLASGRQIWKAEYAAPYRASFAARAHGKGPKSTPVIAGGRLYTLGISGILSAYDIQSGRLAWRKTFEKQFGSTSPDYGTAASPVADGKILIAYTGGDSGGALTAFDLESGEVKWAWSGDGPGYGSPVLADIDGKRHVIVESEKQIISVSAADGGLLWSMPFKTPFSQNAVTALVVSGLIILAGLDQPTFGLRVRWNGKWDLEKVWETKEAGMYMSSPVPAGSLVYGFSNRNKGQLFGLDPASGKVVWRGPARQGENAALVAAGDTLLALTTGASLQVFRAGGDGLQPLRDYKVSDSETWAYPAVTGKGVLVKDKETLALWSPR